MNQTNGAELAGQLVGFVLLLAIPVVLIVLGRRRKAATGGQKGKILFVLGIVLLVLAVLGMLGNLSMNAQA